MTGCDKRIKITPASIFIMNEKGTQTGGSLLLPNEAGRSDSFPECLPIAEHAALGGYNIKREAFTPLRCAEGVVVFSRDGPTEPGIGGTQIGLSLSGLPAT